MTGNIAYLSDFKDFDGGYVTFGGGAYGGRITGKGTIKTDNLDFNDLPDENQILLKIPRQDNMYSFDMKNIVPKDSLTCLVAKATSEESMLWHKRLGHINFKNINKLVKENLVRDLPLKRFENDQTCVACLKGKQHRASCKTKAFNPITKPLFMLHMDLFGLTFVSSLMHKKYCLVVTDDYSRFSWVFFLTTKDETSEILKFFIKEVENLVDKKVKIIRSDNGTEFKNKVMDDFCREKGIKREYSVARTPQQNGVAERKNRTLIEAARTMLADSKLPTTFWAEAVSTACYVQNRVLIVKPHNKTPYELFRGFKPAIGFMKPFGCHVTILNTLDNLGKFDGKSDEENKPIIEGNGPKWLFDLDSLTQSMNYVPVVARTFSNDFAVLEVLGKMLIQTRYSVGDAETRKGLKDGISRIMWEELGKLRNEMRNMVMTNNNGVMMGMQNMPKFRELKVSLISNHLFDIVLIWHKKFVSIMGENVTWMIYKDAILRRFGNSIDGLNVKFLSNGVKYLSFNLLDKLEELSVNHSHNVGKIIGANKMFDEMPIRNNLKQEGVKEASEVIDENIGFMGFDGVFRECDKVGEFKLKDSSEVHDGCFVGLNNIVKKVDKNVKINSFDHLHLFWWKLSKNRSRWKMNQFSLVALAGSIMEMEPSRTGLQ
ncbi:putative ribonuclease H-like domain-containing protein [Tanacetum coccineum]|uniref:Ribonuclease H-like domain-containing protein n=1 Tax=Tanacetum coccineum TaxID=301880 RepID=A0ABQ5ESC6_9ASTR